MRLGTVNGNTASGMIPMGQGNDSYSKQIQSQILNIQSQMQKLSENKEMSAEEKMKKRQDMQQQIMELQNQLRKHQIEQRRENQQKASSSINDMLGGGRNEGIQTDNGLSSSSMAAIISADASMNQVKAQGTARAKLEGRAGVLKAEIKQDSNRGKSSEIKEKELAVVEAKTQAVSASQMGTLSNVNKQLKEAQETDNETNETVSEIEKEDAVSNEEIARREGKTSSTETVGKNIDIML